MLCAEGFVFEIELGDDGNGPALRLVTQPPEQDPAPPIEMRVIQAIGVAGHC